MSPDKFVGGDSELGFQSSKSIQTPMPCKIVKLFVKEGQKLKKNDPVVVVEAMKMEMVLRAVDDSTVALVLGNVGDVCAEGAVVVTFT